MCDGGVALGLYGHGHFLCGLFLLHLHLPFYCVGRGILIGLGATLRCGVVGEADVMR